MSGYTVNGDVNVTETHGKFKQSQDYIYATLLRDMHLMSIQTKIGSELNRLMK